MLSPTTIRRRPDAVLARYRQLREISKRHHHDILKLISGDAMLQQARRLGLAQGRTLILDDMEEMSYVFDLAIYTAPPRRSRAYRFDLAAVEAGAELHRQAARNGATPRRARCGSSAGRS